MLLAHSLLTHWLLSLLKVTEEDSDTADGKRREAMMAMSDGELEKALTSFTEAIQLNPLMAALYAKRAQ